MILWPSYICLSVICLSVICLCVFRLSVVCPSVCPSLKSAMFSSLYSDFQMCEGDNYSCKWFSPLSKLEVVDTDYHHDIWDYIVARGQRSNVSYIFESRSKWMHNYGFTYTYITHVVPIGLRVSSKSWLVAGGQTATQYPPVRISSKNLVPLIFRHPCAKME